MRRADLIVVVALGICQREGTAAEEEAGGGRRREEGAGSALPSSERKVGMPVSNGLRKRVRYVTSNSSCSSRYQPSAPPPKGFDTRLDDDALASAPSFRPR